MNQGKTESYIIAEHKDIQLQDRKMFHGRTKRHVIAGQDSTMACGKVNHGRTERCSIAGQKDLTWQDRMVYHGKTARYTNTIEGQKDEP